MAFISYSHSDARICAWLHASLERYRVPRRLRGARGEFGQVPDRIQPIFRDKEELASAGALADRLQGALNDSDALLVVCSPEAARSRWVNEEILAFKRLGRGHRIYCLIVDGEPHAGDERECFAPALRFEVEADGQLGERPAEPIAADIRPGRDGRALARIKLVAGLLGIDLDTLRRREAQRRYRRMLTAVVASLGGMALALGLAATAWIARNDAERRQMQAEDLIVFMLGDLHQKLEKVGRLDVLDSVGDKALGYFASLDARDMTDTTLEQLAQALTQLGQVQLSQGRYQEALANFRSAYARSKSLAERHPRDGARLFDRGQAEYWIGFVYLQSRDLDQAQVWFTRYRDTCREVFAIDSHRIDWQHELVYGDHSLAVVALERGQLAVAGEGFARARQVLADMAAADPSNVQLQFDLADEISWQGTVEERSGNLVGAEAMLASKADTLREIAKAQSGDPRWKLEWSSAQLMLSEMVRVLGDHGRAEALASAAVDRMRLLVAQDPSNRDWGDAYLRALTMRAAARVGAGKMAAANRDLASARPLIEGLEKSVSDNRIVRRDVILAQTLSVRVALQEGDGPAADRAAHALRLLLEKEDASPTGPHSEFLGMSQIALAMADAAAGRTAKADARLAATHAALAPRVVNSRYWRVLDPWVRLSLLRGDAAEAARGQALLSAMGYVPLFGWPPLAVARRSELVSVSPPLRAPARAQAVVPLRR
ncbi:MAG TPA: toll/interleukin-1 receptor domain-containing protein [Rhodanobacter sp.]